MLSIHADARLLVNDFGCFTIERLTVKFMISLIYVAIAAIAGIINLVDSVVVSRV